jgi:hypothetical protein
MCLSTGGVKLLDFGIASAIGEGDSEAEESTFKGKLSYLAPERLGLGGNGSEPKLDGRIDLFSLGTVLWEVLAGRRLFQGKTDADKLRAVLERPIPPPSSLRGDIPPRLDEIVLKALERDRDKRYLTGQALADDLEELAIDTKYQSRMLPMLLQDLFGVGGSRSHVAISALPPELLVPPPAHAMPTPTSTPTSTLPAVSPDPGPQTRIPARSAELAAAAPTPERLGGSGDSLRASRLEPLPDPAGGTQHLEAGAAGSTGEAVPTAMVTNFSGAEMSGSPTPLPPAPGLGLAPTSPSPLPTPVAAAEAAAPVAGWAKILPSAWREALRRLPITPRQGAVGGLLALVLVLTGIGIGGARSGPRTHFRLGAERSRTRPVTAGAAEERTTIGIASRAPLTVPLPPRKSSGGSAALPPSTPVSSTARPPSSGPLAPSNAQGIGPGSIGGPPAAAALSSPERTGTRESLAPASKIVPQASPKAGSPAHPAHPALARPAPRPAGKTLAAFALAPRPGPPRPGPAPLGPTPAAPRGPATAPIVRPGASAPQRTDAGRAAGVRTGADGRVEKGLSIDPFAEATARLTARPRP